MSVFLSGSIRSRHKYRYNYFIQRYHAVGAFLAFLMPFLVDVLTSPADWSTIWLSYGCLAVQVALSGIYDYTRHETTASTVHGPTFFSAISVVGAGLCALSVDFVGIALVR